MQTEKSNILTIEQQKTISMTGVSSVDAFSENQIRLTVNGRRVTIDGSHLKVLAFSEGSGNFSARGEVNSVKFGGARGNAIKRLFG